MTEKTEIFYSLFWKNKACRNLFLLSKEELLYSKEIKVEDKINVITLPRIILSNVNTGEHAHQLISAGTVTDSIKKEYSIGNTLRQYESIFDYFIDGKFGKSIDKLLDDIENKPRKFIKLGLKLTILNEAGREEAIIKELQHYGFIGKNIKKINEIGNQLEHFILKKEFKNIFSENNFHNLLELLKSFKDIYINTIYSNLYNSNQILVNALHSEDNYTNRLELFDLLYSLEIIEFGREDSFIECTSCDTGMFKGAVQLKIKPIKLNNLICPICNSKLNYYVPYQLNNEIYSIIKEKDGLILNSLCNFLEQKKIKYWKNKHYLNDIEFDCEYEVNDRYYIIECKMYKVNNAENKLKEKIKGDFSKLIKKINRIKGKLENKIIHPVLLINISDTILINSLISELRDNDKDEMVQRASIITIDTIPI